MRGDGQWRAGGFARFRALARRALVTVVGARGEERMHATYHGLQRRAGRFVPPEDGVTLDILSTVAAVSSTLIDVGANVGLYSWFLRRRARPGTMLFALEPHPGVARLLRRNLAALPGAVVLQLAAADRDANAELIVPTGAFGAPVTGLAWVRDDIATSERRGIPVRLRRLDALVEDGTITAADPVFLKIDVEGAEASVLRGAADLLRRHRPILYLECQATWLARQDEAPDSVWGLLEAADYRLYATRGTSFVAVGTVQPDIVNYLAIPDLAAPTEEASLSPEAMRGIIRSWAARRASASLPSALAERSPGAE